MQTFDYIFIVVASIVILFRIMQTFLKKKLSAGVRKEGWTFPAAVIIYNLIIIGSIIEYVLLEKDINFTISFFGFFGGVIGLLLTTLSIRGLGKFWSLAIEIKNSHRLVESSIYHYIRHPYFVGVFFEVSGFILFANAYYISALLLFFVPIIIYRIIIEEKVLASVFGYTFEKYKGDVSAFFPLKAILRIRKDG